MSFHQNKQIVFIEKTSAHSQILHNKQEGKQEESLHTQNIVTI